MKFKSIAISLLFSLIATKSLMAITIIEPKSIGSKKGFYGSVDADFQFSNGDTEKSAYSIDSLLGLGRDKSFTFVSAAYQYSDINDRIDTDDAFVHLRHIHALASQLTWEGFAQFSQDEGSFIEKRELYGLGLRKFIPSKNREIYFGLGVMHENKKFKNTASQRKGLGNFYISAKFKFVNKSNLFFTLYLQPHLERVSNFDATSLGQYTMPISEKLSFKFKVSYKHTETPAVGKSRDNTASVIGLSYQF